MNNKTVFVVSDTQFPFEDRHAVKTCVKAIGELQPDEVIHIGDVMDFPQPSRWTKGTAAEYEGSIHKDCKLAQRVFFEPLREVYDGPVGVIEGNHDLRPRTYLTKYAPALGESGAFNLENLLDFGYYNIEMLPDFYRFAPGWEATHGHLGDIPKSKIGGYTALNGARKFGVNLICGHTHRSGVTHYTGGINGKEYVRLTGLEVGNLMDPSKAHYLKKATGNWQRGVGLITINGNHVQALPIEYKQKKMIINDKVIE